MPRQSRGRSVPRSAPAPAPASSRGAHTATVPTNASPSHAPAPPAAAQGKEPGMIAQMAATAGSVAVGSTIGHGLSSMLFGGGNAAATEAPAPAAQQPTNQRFQPCDFQAKELVACLKVNGTESCQWLIDQLKACQQAAAPY